MKIAEGPTVWLVGERVVKRASARERAVYVSVLAPGAAPALRRSSRRWLELERLSGEHLDFGAPGEAAIAYRWLGRLHRRYLGLVHPTLHRRKPGMVWPAAPAAVTAVLGRSGVGTAKASALGEALAEGPITLVHGDFHRWNLLACPQGLRAVDWEHACCAHPAWDLLLLAPEGGGPPEWPNGPAALLALAAYHEAGPLAHSPFTDLLELQTALRLYVAAVRAARARRHCAGLAPGIAGVLAAHAQREEALVQRLSAML